MKDVLLFLLIFCCQSIFADMITTTGNVDEVCLKIKNSNTLSAEEKTNVLEAMNCDTQLSEWQTGRQIKRQESLLRASEEMIRQSNSWKNKGTATVCVAGDEDFMFVMNNLDMEYEVALINSISAEEDQAKVSHCAIIESVER